MPKNNNRQINDRPKTLATFRLNTDLIEAMRESAQESGQTVTEWMEAAIAQKLSQ